MRWASVLTQGAKVSCKAAAISASPVGGPDVAQDRKSGFCKDCNAQRVVWRKGTNHILHLLLTLVTLGWWLIVWILIGVKFGGWRCEQCGSKRISKVR